MNCSTTSLEAEKIHWRHDNNYVYAGRNILEPYNVRFSVEINSSTGTSNLVIRSVQPSDAGQYECSEDEGIGEGRSAQLIVLDGDPVCKSNMHSSGVIGPNNCDIEPDKIEFSCSVTYYGNIFPVLQWKTREENQSIIDGAVNFTSNKNDVTYTLTMKSTLDLNNFSFICQTTRTFNRNYSCSSDVIKILYVFSSKVTVYVTTNDEVSCEANTSQSCSYKWKWFSGDDSITVFDAHTLKPNRVGWHRCEARCSIGNKSCTVEPMYVEVYSTLAASEKTWLPLLILLVLPVIVLIVVVIYRRRKMPETTPDSLEQIALPLSGFQLTQMLGDLDCPRLVGKEEFNVESGLLSGNHLELLHALADKLPIAYKYDPVLLQTIKIKVAEDNGIVGMTILDKELFVASGKSSEVEVYDSLKFSFSRRWDLKELIDPMDVGSCNINKCLYIFDFKGQYGQSNEILRVDSIGKLIKKWSTGDDWGYGLSVTDESNVILAVVYRNKLNEYSSDGQLIREINLSGARIDHPRHAIKLANDHFVVIHVKDGNKLHRVCVVDGDGNLKKSCGRKCGSTIGQMNHPVDLAVDGNGFVMVAERNKRRVLLFDSDLEFKREILSKEKHGLRRPERILLDETNNRLFVADNEWNSENSKYYDGQIFIFVFRQLSNI